MSIRPLPFPGWTDWAAPASPWTIVAPAPSSLGGLYATHARISVSVPYRRVPERWAVSHGFQVWEQDLSLDLLISLCLHSSGHGRLHCYLGDSAATLPPVSLSVGRGVTNQTLYGCLRLHLATESSNKTLPFSWSRRNFKFFGLFWFLHAAHVWKRSPPVLCWLSVRLSVNEWCSY